MSSYPPPPADATDVLPGEDGGDYAARKAEAAAIADAARLPEWVLLAEIARRRRHGRAAPDDAALAERLRRAWHAPATVLSYLEDETPREQQRWLRVAAAARAAIGKSTSMLTVRLAAEGDAMRNTALVAAHDVALRAILAVSRACRSCGAAVEPARQCYAVLTCYACLAPPPPLAVIRACGDCGEPSEVTTWCEGFGFLCSSCVSAFDEVPR